MVEPLLQAQAGLEVEHVGHTVSLEFKDVPEMTALLLVAREA